MTQQNQETVFKAIDSLYNNINDGLKESNSLAIVSSINVRLFYNKRNPTIATSALASAKVSMTFNGQATNPYMGLAE